MLRVHQFNAQFIWSCMPRLLDNLVLADIGQEKISQESLLSFTWAPLAHSSAFFHGVLPYFWTISPRGHMTNKLQRGEEPSTGDKSCERGFWVLAMSFITSIRVRQLQMPRSMALWSDCDPPYQHSGDNSGQLGGTAGDGVTPELVPVVCFTLTQATKSQEGRAVKAEVHTTGFHSSPCQFNCKTSWCLNGEVHTPSLEGTEGNGTQLWLWLCQIPFAYPRWAQMVIFPSVYFCWMAFSACLVCDLLLKMGR